MREIEKISEALFEKIRDRFTDVSLGDENAKATQDPEKAKFFNFDFTINDKSYGNVTISIIDEMSLKVYFSKNISKNLDDEEKSKWYGFLRELREFAKRNMLSFEPRDITRGTLKIRDIQQVSKADGTYTADEVIGEGRMYGTKKRSYESFGPVRIKIKHSKPVAEEVRGSRSRNIDAIFVENDQGERFRLPFNSLVGARAMARHVSAGGSPTDSFGEHINEMVNEMSQLRPFIYSMRHRTFEDTTTQKMAESAFDYHKLLKHTLGKIKGKKGYSQYKESYTPATESGEVDVDGLKELFVKKTLDERIEQALPLVQKAYNIMKENNNPYAEQFESWAERISEGTWHVPETDEDIQGLADLLRNPIPAGVDGMDAQNALGEFIGDDSLYDDIEELAKVDSEADVHSLVVSWLDYNMPEVLEKIKELSPDGFVRDQGRQQEKPKDWAQAVAADEGIEEGDCKKKETEFHRKLDKLVHDTFGKRAGELEEGKMKGLALDMIELSDEEFEKKYQTKKSDWEEVKNKDLRMDPDQPAYISKNLVKNETTDEGTEESYNPMVPGDSSSPLTYAKKAYCDDDEELDEEGKEMPENPDYSKYDEPTFKRKNPQPQPEKSGWAGYNMDEPAYKRKQEFEKQKEQLKKLAGLN
jgi:hypothetical protein